MKKVKLYDSPPDIIYCKSCDFYRRDIFSEYGKVQDEECRHDIKYTVWYFYYLEV